MVSELHLYTKGDVGFRQYGNTMIVTQLAPPEGESAKMVNTNKHAASKALGNIII